MKCPNCQKDWGELGKTWKKCPECGADMQEKKFSSDDDFVKDFQDYKGKVDTMFEAYRQSREPEEPEEDDTPNDPISEPEDPKPAARRSEKDGGKKKGNPGDKGKRTRKPLFGR